MAKEEKKMEKLQDGQAVDVKTGAAVDAQEVPNNNGAQQQETQQQPQQAAKKRWRDTKAFKIGAGIGLMVVAALCGAGADHVVMTAGKKKEPQNAIDGQSSDDSYGPVDF